MKPELKFEGGLLIAKAMTGVDADKDGQHSIKAEVVLTIDAKEAVSEIIKNEIPQWLKDLLEKVAPQEEPKAE
jgi:hypothetical protein